jgi:hypothetical protein
MLCWWIVLKIKLQLQWTTWVELVLLGLCWVATQGYTPGYQPRTCVVVITWGYTCGWPLRNKEIKMSSMLRVLPVQPYDTMGSVLIEYDARVQPWVLTWGGSWLIGGTVRLVWLNATSKRSCLILFFGVKWVLRWKCTTPAGCKTNRLAMFSVMDNLSL